MSENRWHPKSLLDLFQAPEGYEGHFGWVCGYSADAGFMNSAAERFTGLTNAQRAYAGDVKVALVLDPHNEALSFVDVPGVAHCLFRQAADLPFRLLHAKVALLGFRCVEDTQRWRLRLVVSTGNWTRQTLEDSLDLAWTAEVDSAQLAPTQAVGMELSLCCADVAAASSMLHELRPLVDLSLVAKTLDGVNSYTSLPWEDLDSWVAACRALVKGIKPRFFDNRTASLHSQLPTLITAHGKDTARNYLAMGSGFYETVDPASGALAQHPNRQQIPSVLAAIVSTLRTEKLLTKSAEMDVFVNPRSCQAVATLAKNLQYQDYSIRQAVSPPGFFSDGNTRSLHAKFLFGAYWREDSNECNSAWVYLGSGNLTGPGFLHSMSRASGNLEAGVVFAPQDLCWEHTPRQISPQRVISNLLPIQWDDATQLTDGLETGAPMEEHEAHFAPPVSWLLWEARQKGGILSTQMSGVPFDVLTRTDGKCRHDETGFLWPDERPRQVEIEWRDADGLHKGFIPVVDELGRIAATTLPTLDLDDAMSQLASFPELPGDDEVDDPQPPDDKDLMVGASATDIPPHRYPVREMMALVEQVAEIQTGRTSQDWAAWCRRLEQTLRQLKPNAPINYFRDLEINPLSPLMAKPFRPAFAEDASTIHGTHYEESLKRVMEFWEVSSLRQLRGSGS